VAVVTASSDIFHYSPLKLREYLCCAVPVVAPSVGQIKETLCDGRDALLYPVGDVTSLASALVQLAQSPRLRAQIGRAGYASETERGGIAAQLDLVVERLKAVSGSRA
jgi:glycosyltransferase involved in cell wall biosynthesis